MTMKEDSESPPNGMDSRRGSTIRKWTPKKKRRRDEDEQDWWFASTAIPLLAATIAPAANVFSIAALVSYWRTSLINPSTGAHVDIPLDGFDIKDPYYIFGTNLASLVCGYAGNISLFLNFTNRVPYIFALPVTVVLWFISFAILTGIQISMSIYSPPGHNEDYTQAFWYGVIASVLYLFCAFILLINMLGYFLGHYPKHFNLTESQRTLILQTFLFFIWLAGGAGVFQAVQRKYGTDTETRWNYSDALYFCDVTILTIGYGDETPNNNVGRGFVLPYSVGGIIMLGLMVSSIARFAREISDTNVVQKRTNRQRLRTIERTVTTDEQRLRVLGRPGDLAVTDFYSDPKSDTDGLPKLQRRDTLLNRTVRRTGTGLKKMAKPKRERKLSVVVLRDEKERFEAMRKIQRYSRNFKKWSTLTMSLTVLILLWNIGAVVFWQLEKEREMKTYFTALYYAYVSLLTIGYGEFVPQTNAGRPFFVLWSLLAVPSITILISDLADTFISSFQSWTNKIADFTLLARNGIWRELLNRNITVVKAYQERRQRKAEEDRVEEGFAVGPDKEEAELHPIKTIEELAAERNVPRNRHLLARRLGTAIQTVAGHLKEDNSSKRAYSYEEWVDYTELIRFTKGDQAEEEEDEDEGLIEWDWIGEDGPIMSHNESSWLLDRLVESMNRYVRGQARAADEEEETNDHERGVSTQDHYDKEGEPISSSNGTPSSVQDADSITRVRSGQG